MDLKLNGKTCLITGASRGIGHGTAKVLAAEGVRLSLLARRTPLLNELADDIAAAGGRLSLAAWRSSVMRDQNRWLGMGCGV